ncbi:hypothetical protein DEM91_09415 [Prevotella sp. TCVGH]|uniref:hypothetical protein n=1 Tax=Prevotella sp. TCVGH TaxID=2182433 RepID=UPI00201D81DF|nr:hypothetical protein [Prevotella sp. TCVGH]MCL6748830.1 hypothetical protein [Prevotella sp. TCVGH]
MNLIAVSGSDKTEWAFVEQHQLIDLQETEGLNPYFQTRREMSRSIRLGLGEAYFKRKLGHIYFYGAGCSDEARKKQVSQSLVAQFKTPATVESDLLGAARGLCMDSAGVVCILGTGSNSCFYDGTRITKNVRPGGYILGDEGSASVIGRAFLSDVLKELAPPELIEAFYFKYHTSAAEVMSAVYDKPLPHYYLSSVTSFLVDYQHTGYVSDLVTDSFKSFLHRNLFQYDYQQYPVYFTGKTAMAFSVLLRSICRNYDFEPAKVSMDVVQGLVAYHATHLVDE